MVNSHCRYSSIMVEYNERMGLTLLAATSAGSFITPLMSTSMNLSLMSIGSEFGIGSHDLAYVNTMFLLGSVIAMVPCARMADLKGLKKTFIVGLLILAVCSVLSMVSPSFEFLLLMRFLIGIGASMGTITSMALLTYVFPVTRRGWAIGVNTTFVYIGLSIGPTAGGLISDYLGWRAIFAVVLLITVFTLYRISKFDSEIVPCPEGRMDWKGGVLWGMMILLLMSGLMNITTEWGPVAAVVGTVLLFALAIYLRRAPEPVLSTSMFSNRSFTKACIAAFMNYAASYSITFFMALYMQSIGNLSASEAGLLMLIQPFMQVLLTTRMGALSDRIENKRLLPTLGMAITCAGIALFLFLGTEFSLPYMVVTMLVVGVGLGTFSSPNASFMMSVVEPSQRSEASGLVSIVRQTGMMVSMSISMAMISVTMGSTDNLTPETYGLFVDVIHYVFAVCVAMCVVGAVCSWGKEKIVFH